MAFRRFANSLATRLIVISIATVALGLVMRMTLLPWVVRGSLQDVVMGQQATLANYVADDIDAKVRARRALLERLAIELPPALLGQPEALQAWLAERQMLAPLFSHGFIVIRPDGRGAWAAAARSMTPTGSGGWCSSPALCWLGPGFRRPPVRPNC